MKKLSYLLFAAGLALVSCTAVNEAEKVNDDIQFTASIEATATDGVSSPDTRTYVDKDNAGAVRMHWTKDDLVSIFRKSTFGQKYKFNGETGDRSGTFSKVPTDDFGGGFELSKFYSVYPYAENTSIAEEGLISYTFPDTQSYAEDSFGLGAGTMVAVTADTDDNNLIFKNVCAFLKLQVYGGATIAKVTLQGNSDEVLAGPGLISAVYGEEPSVTMTGDVKLLTLECGAVATSTSSTAPTTFWFAIPPVKFTNGFTVKFTDNQGNVAEKSTNRNLTFTRNHITPMEAFEVLPQAVPDPEPEIPALPPVNSGLPVLYVYTPGFEPGEATTNNLTNTEFIGKTDWVAGSHAYLKMADNTVQDLGTANIRGRGNTTWNYKKKPYAFKLDTKAALLGMPADKRWDLLANYLDRTRLRNDLALELGRRLVNDGVMGEDWWTPKGEYVELVINDVFLGNYYLVEHIKIAKKRVNIKEMKTTDITEPNITGGYLLELGIEMDEGEGHQFWTDYFTDTYPYNRHGKNGNNYHLPVMIKDPEDITTEQFTWIKDYINDVQGSIVRGGSSWLDKVDIDSFICWMFIQECIGNYEPFHPKSAYMYKGREGKLVMGPLWDFDYGTFKDDYKMTPIYHYSIWYPYMLQNSTFAARVKELWPIVKPVLREVCNEYATKFVNGNAEIMPLATSIDNDWVRWYNLGGQPTVNNDEGLGVWVAFKKLTDNLSRRITQMNDESICK